MKKFVKSHYKNLIVERFGSITNLKKHLVDTAKYSYGAMLSEVEIEGAKFCYTSNPNHFAKFYVKLPSVGFTQTFALGRSGFTKNGKIRIGKSRLSLYMIEL